MPGTELARPESDIIDLTRDRDMIQRIEFVYDRILELCPEGSRKDPRYKILKSLMKDSLKDIALIPDTAIATIMRECGTAFLWVADGSMSDLDDPGALPDGSYEEPKELVESESG